MGGDVPSHDEILGLIAEAALAHGIPASWLEAIVRQESNFDPTVAVTDGTDGARGGAYGLGQMTYKTALAWGFTGQPEDLLDPKTNLDIVAEYLKALSNQFAALADVASAYNSGKPLAQAMQIAYTDPDPARRARHLNTVTKYVPRVLGFEAEARTRSSS